MTPSSAAAPELRDILGRAARYRFLHVLLAPPAAGRSAQLTRLASEIEADGPGEFARLAAPSDPDVELEAFRLVGQAGDVSTCASDYVEGGYADKGPILADVAGFYRAFGFSPSLPENPDHFATLFEFLSLVALKESWARADGDEEQAEIARNAEEGLLADHVHPYLGRFARRLAERAPPGGAYEDVAAYLAKIA